MTQALLIFPHHLFVNHPGLSRHPETIVFIEDSLFFGDSVYPVAFHKQKLWFHRASMTKLHNAWKAHGLPVRYINHTSRKGQLQRQLESLKQDGVDTILSAEPTDFVLERRLRQGCQTAGLRLDCLPSPMFLNTRQENDAYRTGKSRWFMADFYKWQRQRMNILMDGDQPAGGQWSFDADNRKKVPKAKLATIPSLPLPTSDALEDNARRSILEDYPTAPGDLDQIYYPTDHASAKTWLQEFVDNRLNDFGAYEDAIVEGESWLWHSVLTPMLNVGLLTPQQVLDALLAHADRTDVPLNSLEGFVRQIIGWREFMRATYEDLGVQMRTTNHWQHTRPLPHGFWTGETGIDPIDDTIRRILKTGYCHHIERLMVLGGFMFLCEIDPDEIYRWFMALFVDAYDWVMVPNVYAMSQNADGGLITTKPYFSGSAYVRKMSHWKTGEWSDIWDGLYWRWIWNHRDELGKNPRWSMMVASVRKMDESKRKAHLDTAERYLRSLSAG